jgi:hypothetical protein
MTVYDENTTIHNIFVMPGFWEDEIQNEANMYLLRTLF